VALFDVRLFHPGTKRAYRSQVIGSQSKISTVDATGKERVLVREFPLPADAIMHAQAAVRVKLREGYVVAEIAQRAAEPKKAKAKRAVRKRVSIVKPKSTLASAWSPRVLPVRATALCFAPDGEWLVTLSGQGKAALHFWSANEVEPRKILRLPGTIHLEATALAVAPDGASVLTGHRIVTLIDTKTFKSRGRLVGHRDHVYGIAFSPDGKFVATGGADRSVRVWQFSGTKEVRRIEHHAVVHGVIFMPDGESLVTTCSSPFQRPLGALQIVSVAGDAVSPLTVPESGSVNWWTPSLSPDGKTLAVAFAGRGAFAFWDLQKRRLLHVIPARGRSYGINGAFSPDGKLFVAGHRDRVSVWKVGTWKELASVKGSGPVALSPDGAYLAFISPKGDTAVASVTELVRA
jgi:WD40 repeat protein